MISTFMASIHSDSTDPSGFSGAVVDPATATVNLWWNGTVPDDVLAAIRSVDGKLSVIVRSAPFTRFDLMSRVAKARSEMANVDLAIPKEDGSGVVVTHADGQEVDVSAIEQLVGVPVTSAVDSAPVDLAGGRQADVDPHWGGAGIYRNVTNGVEACSTGFSVLYAGIQGRVLSAAHCDITGDLKWFNTNGDTYSLGGGYISVAPSVDSMLIDPVGGTAGRVYSGPVFTGSSRKVAGTDTNDVGDFVRASGANSGEHASLSIINDAFAGTCNSYSCTLIVAEADPGDAAAAQGDSGGPVYHVRGDDRVDAKGIILQGAQQVSCPYTYYTAACYNEVRYGAIRPLLSVWNVTIETIS